MNLNRNNIKNHLSKSEIDLFDQIKRGDVDGVLRCLSDQRTRKKININCFNEKDSTPLFVAIIECENSVIQSITRILLKFGALVNIQNSVGHTALHHACRYEFDGTGGVVNILLRNGADPNLSESLNGFTPLHEACRYEIIPAIQSLFLYNADVNCLDNEGETPLMKVCRSNSIDEDDEEEGMIYILLDNYASVNFKKLMG